MASNAKTIAELLNGDVTVTATDIADDAVTSAKIATGAVIADGLGAGAVTNEKLGAGAVTATKLGTGVVTNEKLGAGVVTNEKLGSGAVTVNKVSGNLRRRNMIINGAMQVSQRGTSITGITSGNNRTADRFSFTTGTNGGTYTLSTTTTVPSGEGFKKSLKLDCTTAGDYSTAGTGTMLRCSPFEIQDCARLSYGTSGAKKLTVSFWTRASYTGTFTALLVTHDTAQRNIIKTFTIASADTWQKVVLTYDGDTGSTFTGSDINLGVSLDIWMGGGSDYTGGSQTDGVWRARSTHNSSILEGNGTKFGTNTSHNFYITGVQVEQNDTATDFEHRTYAEELTLCQRYFEKDNPATPTSFGGSLRGVSFYLANGSGNAQSRDGAFTSFATTKRTTPTMTLYSYNGTSGACSWITGGGTDTNVYTRSGTTGFQTSSSTYRNFHVWFAWTAHCEL